MAEDSDLFISRLIDRCPTQEMKDRVSELAMRDLGNANLEELLESIIRLIEERQGEKLRVAVKKCYDWAIRIGDKEKADWCAKALVELATLSTDPFDRPEEICCETRGHSVP